MRPGEGSKIISVNTERPRAVRMLVRKGQAGRFAVLYSERLKEYDLGHVLTQDRYQHFIDLFEEKLGRLSDFTMVDPPCATDDDLALIHDEAYIRRIEACESWDPHDTPLSPGLVRAAKLLAGAGKYGGELVHLGRFSKAFVVGGGVQHARRNQEKGFGVFSDVGICAENLMKNFGVRRISILDTDAHAGDGIYDIFAMDRRVLFVSIHQDPFSLYPGTGFVDEIGRDDGLGYSVNVPLPPGAGDESYERVLKEIFVPLCEEFAPEIILMVDGADAHFSDRLTQMGATLEGIKTVGSITGQTANRVCGGKVVDFVGSGYSFSRKIVSLGWLASIAGVTGVEVDLKDYQPLPPEFRTESRVHETQQVVQDIQARLSPYWRCFA